MSKTIKPTGRGSIAAKLFAPLYNSDAMQNSFDTKGVADYMSSLSQQNPDLGEEDLKTLFAKQMKADPKVVDPYVAKYSDAYKTAAQNPLKGNLGLSGDFENLTGRKATLDALGANISAHPFKAAGAGLSAAGNVAGLFDNDKIGGQVLGAGLGIGADYLVPAITGGVVSPYWKMMLPMLGGNLGSLFDKLRANKEQAQEQAQQYSREY